MPALFLAALLAVLLAVLLLVAVASVHLTRVSVLLLCASLLRWAR